MFYRKFFQHLHGAVFRDKAAIVVMKWSMSPDSAPLFVSGLIKRSVIISDINKTISQDQDP